MHVPISANFAVLDDNLIDDNVYYYEPPCLANYLSELLDRFMLYYLTNESKFYAIDLLGAYFDLSGRKKRTYTKPESMRNPDCGWRTESQERQSNDIVCYMVHVTTSGESTTKQLKHFIYYLTSTRQL